MNAKLKRVWSDWNRIQSGGIPLSSRKTPTEVEPEIAALHGEKVLLADGGDVVEALVVRRPDGTWWGEPDWDTQRDATDEERWPATHPAVW